MRGVSTKIITSPSGEILVNEPEDLCGTWKAILFYKYRACDEQRIIWMKNFDVLLTERCKLFEIPFIRFIEQSQDLLSNSMLMSSFMRIRSIRRYNPVHWVISRENIPLWCFLYSFHNKGSTILPKSTLIGNYFYHAFQISIVLNWATVTKQTKVWFSRLFRFFDNDILELTTIVCWIG